MARQRGQIIALTAVLAILAFLGFGLIHGRSVRGEVGGRQVSGHANGLSTVHSVSDGTTMTLQLGSRTAKVTADAVELPDGASVKIPAACKQVEVEETGTGLRVLLDGVPAN